MGMGRYFQQAASLPEMRAFLKQIISGVRIFGASETIEFEAIWLDGLLINPCF
jgi:hypothetical protein